MRHTLIQLPKGEQLDPFDPNNWVDDDYEHRIYASDDLQVFAVVDAIYYPILVRHRWCVHDRKKPNHAYLHRSVSTFHAPDGERYLSEFTGRPTRNRNRVQTNLFLHTAVMLLSGKPQPTPKHNTVDHKDRQVWNCLEENLEWATRGMQNANRRAKI